MDTAQAIAVISYPVPMEEERPPPIRPIKKIEPIPAMNPMRINTCILTFLTLIPE